MKADARDAGLVRGLGTWGLAASIVSMVVGAGIFAVPGALAAAVGAYAPMAFLACGVAIGAVAVCFAEGGSRVPTSGGAYGYIEASLGPLAGYVCGTLLWVSDALASGGVAAAFAAVVASAIPLRLAAFVRPAAIVGLVGTIALLNLGGVRRGAQLMGAATAVKLIPLLAFVLVGASYVRGANFAIQPGLTSVDAGRAVILAMFALTGMEGSLCASGEVAQPARTIPRAIALALVAATTFALLTAAMNLPIDYMEVVDARGYDWHGITGAFLTDALISATACILLAIVLRRKLFSAHPPAGLARAS